MMGCSGNVIYGGGGNGATGGTGGVGTGGSGGATSPCPATAPAAGATCAAEGRRCTYGTDARPDCRAEWTCSSGKWATTKNTCAPATSGCTSVVADQVCATEGDHCVVGGSTICTCNACLGAPCMAPPPRWSCAGPPATAGCPGIVPNDGTTCATEGVECVYGNPCLGSGADVTCTKGIWTWNTQIACAA